MVTIMDPKGVELTTKQVGRSGENYSLNDEAPGDNATMQQQAVETVKVLDRSPVKKEFTSKGELEMTDKKRLDDFNMYMYMKEFHEVDIVENMDLNEKYEKRKKVEAIL